mgnify:CR=1 FL=1
MGLFNIFSKKEHKEDLDKGLEKTKEGVFSKLARAVAGKSKVDEEVLDNLEEVLITSDVGVDTTVRIIERIEKRVAEDKYMNTAELNRILRTEITALLEENKSAGEENFSYEKRNGMPYVVMVVGVNGAGKTTTIGKLASKLKNDGKKVYIGAADTFRAAAADQLETWGAKVDVPVVRSDREGADPASVAFEASAKAKELGTDVLIIDTAGRLQNKANLMDELGKIRRVAEKNLPVDEVLLVLDATTGQNGMAQAKVFAEAIGITGVVLTKLDGSAKGGIVISVQKELGVPVKLVGVGEGPDDLAPFDPESFVDGILGE